MIRVALVFLGLLLPAQSLAQGFAGMGSEAGDGYAEVRPETSIAFPADHGPHPDFRIEWWYVTANLEDAEGTPYGLQWTLFRSALAPEGAEEGWQARQFWMAHAAVTSAETHRAAERFARGGVGQAGVTTAPFAAHLDDWRFESTERRDDAPFAPLQLTARGEGFSYDLALSTSAPPVLQGEGGFSVKSTLGQASHYYAQPFFEAEGVIEIDGQEIAVTGRAWMDREWSTRPLEADQTGWDWFALRLGAETAVMVYRLRHDNGEDFVTGNWATDDGRSDYLPPGSITMTPTRWTGIGEREVPTHWRLEIPERGVDIETAPVNPQSWMDVSFEYWEGPISFTGSHDGVGYLEMTGY